tara:strand:- start:6 stop:353 length:348 start_codon:yes stop_codon:yes gene_type:complete
MKKFLSLFGILFLLNSCAETMALLGPASTAFGGGNLAQSAASSAVSYGVKKETGKSPSEHIYAYMKDKNPNKDKKKCVEFLEATDSELCAIVKKNINETKKKIVESSKIKFLNTN